MAQRVFIKKYQRHANVVSEMEINGETLYWCDNTFGLGRIFSEDEVVLEPLRKKYVTLSRLRELDKALGYLGEYTNSDDLHLVIGESINHFDEDKTSALAELAQVNRKRAELIGFILK